MNGIDLVQALPWIVLATVELPLLIVILLAFTSALLGNGLRVGDEELDSSFLSFAGIEMAIWGVKAALVFALVWGNATHMNYAGLGGLLCLVTAVNFVLTMFIIIAWSDNSPPSRSSRDSKESARKSDWAALGIITISMIFVFLGPTYWGSIKEAGITEALCSASIDKEERFVLPKTITKIERDGETVWEIYSEVSNTTYELPANMSYNPILTELAKRTESPSTRRSELLRIRVAPDAPVSGVVNAVALARAFDGLITTNKAQQALSVERF